MKKRVSEDQLGLPIEGLEAPLETPEMKAGKIANDMFRPWYKEFYEGRYVQNVGHITRVLKKFVLDVVVNGKESPDMVNAALRHLGLAQQVVTEASLQYALGLAKKRDNSRQEAGAFEEMLPQEEFTDFLHNAQNVDYGKSGSEF